MRKLIHKNINGECVKRANTSDQQFGVFLKKEKRLDALRLLL